MHLFSLVLVCSIATVYPTRDIISGVFKNLIPGNKKPGAQRNRPKPSYGAPKPSYGAPKPSYGAPKPSNNAPKPSYGAPKPKPSYGAPKPSSSASKPRYKPQLPRTQKPRYKNRPSNQKPVPSYKKPSPNLGAPTSSNLQPPSAQSYNSAQSTSSLTDQEMAALILSMHSMMQQIVASQTASSGTSVDSYGSPQGQVLNNAVQTGSSYTGPSSGTNTAVQASNTYQASNNGQVLSNSNQGSSTISNSNQGSYVLPQSSQPSYSAPVIQSTLEQIARNLAEYQAGGENIKPRTGKDEELTEKEEKYKPVRFPRNPTVLEILTILESEQRKKTQSGNKKSNEEDIEIPDLIVDTYF